MSFGGRHLFTVKHLLEKLQFENFSHQGARLLRLSCTPNNNDSAASLYPQTLTDELVPQARLHLPNRPLLSNTVVSDQFVTTQVIPVAGISQFRPHAAISPSIVGTHKDLSDPGQSH